MFFRERAEVLQALISITDVEHTQLRALGADRLIDWSTSEGPHAGVIKKFRSEVKDHYHLHQCRRCCYCSLELDANKGTYDAEHILDKSTYPEYMFNVENLAATCRTCNQFKSNKPVSATGEKFAELSKISGDYSIVHPHLDEWDVHLHYDAIGRIKPNIGSSKGSTTINICGIESLNAARLADKFSANDRKSAENWLREFLSIANVERKKKIIELLEEPAMRSKSARAKAVLSALTKDVEQLPIEH